MKIDMLTKKRREKITSNRILESSPTYVKGVFIVTNDKGLHTRPSTELVKSATRYRADVTLIYQDLRVNAKSLLGILTLAASRGSRIYVEAAGEDAQLAVDAILELAENKFYFHY